MSKRTKGPKARRPKATKATALSAASVTRPNGRPMPRAPNRGLVSKLRVTLHQERAVDMRLSGMSYVQIGNELDIEAGTAWTLVKTAYDNHVKQLSESIEQVREMELGKLDKIDAVLWGLLHEGGGVLVTEEDRLTVHGPVRRTIRRRPGIGGVIDRLLAVQQRRSALLGLDAATKYEHTGPGGGPIALEADGYSLDSGILK